MLAAAGGAASACVMRIVVRGLVAGPPPTKLLGAVPKLALNGATDGGTAKATAFTAVEASAGDPVAFTSADAKEVGLAGAAVAVTRTGTVEALAAAGVTLAATEMADALTMADVTAGFAATALAAGIATALATAGAAGAATAATVGVTATVDTDAGEGAAARDAACAALNMRTAAEMLSSLSAW